MYNRAELSKSLKEAKKSKVSKKVVNTVVDLTGRGYKNPKNKDAAAIKLYTDSIVNPTEKDLMLYADNGVQVRKQPFDESTTYIPGATSIIEVPISDDGGSIKYLTHEEIAEYRAGGYIVEELPQAQDGLGRVQGNKKEGIYYSYPTREDSLYNKDANGWWVRNPNTKGRWFSITDPKRIANLEKNAKKMSQFELDRWGANSPIGETVRENEYITKMSTGKYTPETAKQEVINEYDDIPTQQELFDNYFEAMPKKSINISGLTNQPNTLPTYETYNQFDLYKQSKKFTEDWLNSPMYKKMLGPNSIWETDRKQHLDKASLNYPDRRYDELYPGYGLAAGWADPSNDGVFVDPTTQTPDGYGQFDLMAHELSHITDAGGIFIPQKDLDLMTKYKNVDPNNGNQIYIADPSETRARLNAIRFLGKNKGIYDPFTEEVTPKIYELLKTMESAPGTNQPYNELKRVYSDEEILDMLNTISKNDNQPTDINQAKFGGVYSEDIMYPPKHNPANHFAVTDPRSMQKGGSYYTVPGSKGVYRKVGNTWEVDWNRSGNFQALSKGDVKEREKVLNQQAKPLFDDDYYNMMDFKNAGFQSAPSKSIAKKSNPQQAAAQKNFDKNFKVTEKSNYEKIEDKANKLVEDTRKFSEEKGIPFTKADEDRITRDAWNVYGNVYDPSTGAPIDPGTIGTPTKTNVTFNAPKNPTFGDYAGRAWDIIKNPIDAFNYSVATGDVSNMPWNYDAYEKMKNRTGYTDITDNNLVGSAINAASYFHPAGALAHGLIDLAEFPSRAYENIKKGDWSSLAGDAALTGLEFVPGIGLVDDLAKGAKRTYNNVATGNSFLTDLGVRAWKNPAADLDGTVSETMFNNILQSDNFTPAEKAMLKEYQYANYPFTTPGAKQDAFNALIGKANLIFPEDAVVTRAFSNPKSELQGFTGTEDDIKTISMQERPSAFSAGVSNKDKYYYGNTNRIVLSGRNLKKVEDNFIKQRYQPLEEGYYTNIPDEGLTVNDFSKRTNDYDIGDSYYGTSRLTPDEVRIQAESIYAKNNAKYSETSPTYAEWVKPPDDPNFLTGQSKSSNPADGVYTAEESAEIFKKQQDEYKENLRLYTDPANKEEAIQKIISDARQGFANQKGPSDELELFGSGFDMKVVGKFPNKHGGFDYVVQPKNVRKLNVKSQPNWQKPSKTQLKQEYHVEHELKGNTFFNSEDEFMNAVKNAKVEQITPEMDASISYRSRTNTKDDMINLSKRYKSWPEFRNENTINAIYEGMSSGKDMDMPIVLEFSDGTRRVFSGNTRMDAAFQLGKNPKVLVVKVPQSSGSSNNFIKSGLGGMDMSRYEIKNPDYFTQLLNTYDNKALSASNKKFYKDLIASVKKQNGLVTERQYNELQRLKTGNFNFGKKGYDKGGYVDDQITHFQTGGPTYISATNPGAQLGYSPLFDTVTYNPFDVIQNINNPWWKAHEDFHHKQNMEGRMSTYGSVGERPNPYAASSESINTYYDRRESDINNIIDDMIAKNPSLQFIPRDKLRESVKPNGQGQPSFVGAEDLQYSDPTTLEGEARLEEMKFRRDGGHTIDKNDPGNNALELHMFYDKNNIMQNGGKALQKGQIYTYAPNNTGLSQAYYKLDDNNNILVKAEGSSQYVPIKDPTGNRRKTLEYGLTTGSTKLYGTPEQYAKYNKKPSSFNDFFFSKEEALNNIHQDNAAKCLEDAGHNCLSSAFLYYDRHVAPRLGLDNSWTMKEHAKLTSGSKNSNPRYGDVGESWDSWDIAAGLLEGGGKQFYKSSSEQGIAPSAEWWKKQNLPIGTIINAGSKGASVDYGKGLAYNLKKGLIPSNHSAVVIGYDNDGIPYIYDYGHIRKASDPNALINGLGVTNIVAPKEVLNHTYSELKKGNKLKDEVTPFRYNIADAALNAVSDIDEMKPFMQNLQYHKPAIMAALGISNKTYDDYAKRAAAIALTETKGGDDASIRWKGIVPVPSYLTDKIGLGATQGITQINSDVLFSSPRTTKQLEKLGIYKDSYDPYNPKHIAMATMVMMDDASRVAMANLKKYKTNKQDLDPAAAMYYQWNSPSTLVKGKAQGDNANVKRFMTNYNMIKSLSKQDGGSIQYLSPDKIKMYRDAGYVVIEEPED